LLGWLVQISLQHKWIYFYQYDATASSSGQGWSQSGQLNFEVWYAGKEEDPASRGLVVLDSGFLSRQAPG